MHSKTPEFDSREQQQVYEFVEENGVVERETLKEAGVGIETEEISDSIAELKREGFLEELDGKLRVAVERGEPETYERDGLEYTVRPAEEQDLPGIIDVIREVSAEKTTIVAETVAEELDHDDALIRFNQLESRMFFVATVDDEVVGWLHLEAPELKKLSHTTQLTVGVIEEYRGYGIGRRLMERGLDWAENQGYYKAYNSFPATNRRAIEFIDSLDYEAHCEAVRKDHYIIDGEFVDELNLAVYLDPE